ncbi:MAG: hypothetical protein AAFN65_07760, partial [Bacteroidota bacterium]
RKGTHYRFILLNILTCLLEIGDLEFTHDTNESLNKSRNIYVLTLKLIETENLENTPVTLKPLAFYHTDSTSSNRTWLKFEIARNFSEEITLLGVTTTTLLLVTIRH